MFKLRLYIETTVFNYFYDTERKGHEDVVKLFEAIKAGKFEAYTSYYVTEELKKAPEPKRSNMLSLSEHYGITILDPRQDIVDLADKYRNAGIIPQSQVPDSLHIAAVSVYELDAIVSYNFNHINRAKTKMYIPLINMEEGLRSVYIYTAEEVLNYEGANDGGRDSGDGSGRS